MSQVRVGVIGVGALGRHHVRLYQQCPSAHLVGIYDTSAERAAEVADEFDTTPFEQLETLVSSCDALNVAVPTDRHHPVVKDLLQKGKHVLVEKPIAPNVSAAEELVDLATRRDVVFGVGHVERYNPVLECIEKVPGEPRFLEAYRLAKYPPPREGSLPRGTEVSVVHDLMIHDVDILLSLVKQPVSRLEAVGVPVLSETIDIANARITFENGCVANLTASRVSSETLRKIRLFKSQAYLSLDYGAQQGEMAKVQDGSIRREKVPVDPRNALQEELEDFCTCILKKKMNNESAQPRVTGHAGLEALKVVDRITGQINEQRDTCSSAYIA